MVVYLLLMAMCVLAFFANLLFINNPINFACAILMVVCFAVNLVGMMSLNS